jgi:hypothetical protein
VPVNPSDNNATQKKLQFEGLDSFYLEGAGERGIISVVNVQSHDGYLNSCTKDPFDAP